MLVKTPCLTCGKEIEVHYEPGSYNQPDGSEPPFCSDACWDTWVWENRSEDGPKYPVPPSGDSDIEEDDPDELPF